MADITKITYRIAQGEATHNDWMAFADYAQRRLQQAYPDATIDVDTVRHDADAYLNITTRQGADEDVPGHLYRAEQEAEEFVGRLWDEFGAN